jgi:tetratricopeptide (TPR) repeat protein
VEKKVAREGTRGIPESTKKSAQGQRRGSETIPERTLPGSQGQQQQQQQQVRQKSEEAQNATPRTVQDHLRAAKLLRERGDYARALEVLEKAKTMDPSNREVQAELEKVRKACIAERDTLNRTDLNCS